MKYLIAILSFCLIGCGTTVIPITSPKHSGPPINGPINHSGTQLSNVNNYGTMSIYAVPKYSEKTSAPQVVDQDNSDITKYIIDKLKTDEGFECKPYTDQRGKTHIGYGRNLDDKGISERVSLLLLKEDILEANADLSKNIFKMEWDKLPFKIKSVLINMRFQMGYNGFREFDEMIFAVRARDWVRMIEEMEDSVWATEQTPNRVNSLVKIVESVIEEENPYGKSN